MNPLIRRKTFHGASCNWPALVVAENGASLLRPSMHRVKGNLVGLNPDVTKNLRDRLTIDVDVPFMTFVLQMGA